MSLKKKYFMSIHKTNGGRLPSGYQEVEYIQSSGTQYINTGLTPNGYLSVSIKINSSAKETSILGGLAGWGDRAISLFINSGWELTWAYANRWASSASNTFPQDTDVEITTNRGTLKFLTYTLTNTNSSFNYTTRNIVLFATNGPLGVVEFSSMKMYYCKWYNNSTLIRDFVPCYRKADGEIGLYDLVNDVFYTNQGSGTFTKGADV